MFTIVCPSVRPDTGTRLAVYVSVTDAPAAIGPGIVQAIAGLPAVHGSVLAVVETPGASVTAVSSASGWSVTWTS